MSEFNFSIDFSDFKLYFQILLFIMIVTNLPALFVFLRLEYQIYKEKQLD